MAGYNTFTNYENWVNDQYNAAAPTGGWTDDAIKNNQSLYNSLEYWKKYNTNDVSRNLLSSTGKGSFNPYSTNYTGNERKQAFNSLGLSNQALTNWSNQNTAKQGDALKAILNKYQYKDPNAQPQGIQPYNPNQNYTNSPTTGNAPQGTQPAGQQPTGLLNNTDVYGTLLANPNQPANAALTGLMAELEKMNQNNATYLNYEKQRADEIMQMLRDTSSTKTTDSYTDILNNTMSSTNPLLKLATNQANEEMSRRGLLNSSLGIEAAQEAYLKQAQDIAKAEASGQQYNATEQNNMQRQLLGELGNTGRQSLDFMSSIYGNDQKFNNTMAQEKQKFAFDRIADQEKTALDMDKEMLNYTNSRAIEMLKQQSGLYAQYLSAYSTIASSEIPQSAKDSQLKALASNIDGAVNAANAYSKLKITKTPEGGYTFNTVYNSELGNGKATVPSVPATPEAQAAQDEIYLNQKVNEIYKQVRVGGGDTPEESLIDRWRRNMAWTKQNSPYTYTQAMGVYANLGFNNNNWQSVLKQMNSVIEPVKAELEKMNQDRNEFYL